MKDILILLFGAISLIIGIWLLYGNPMGFSKSSNNINIETNLN